MRRFPGVPRVPACIWPLAPIARTLLGESAVTVLRAAGGLARRAYARYRQRREARNIRDVLRGLDDRMLRDLGLDRSEIASVAAEVTGEAEYTRVRAQLSSHGLP